VIKSFSYSVRESSNDWRVVMGKMKHCIGEVNEIYERYCFTKRDKLPATEMVGNFVAGLKTLTKTCNFWRIKKEQTTKMLPRTRVLALNRCIDVCCSEEVTSMQIKLLSVPVDSIHQVN